MSELAKRLRHYVTREWIDGRHPSTAVMEAADKLEKNSRLDDRNPTVINIAGREIGTDLNLPYVVAELSANHNGELSRACKLIEAAKWAGADAVKIQTYTPEMMTIDAGRNPDFTIGSGTWSGMTLWELYTKAQTPIRWLPDLFAYAKKAKITLFSSPFSPLAVTALDAVGCPAYKIASPELVDFDLLRVVGRTGKPTIMSTGLAPLDHIMRAVSVWHDAGGKELALLHCVSAYPTPLNAANLARMTALGSAFSCPIGLSDHTQTSLTAVLAVAMGASIIEKHITLGPEVTVDSEFSLTPSNFRTMVHEIREARAAMGEWGFDVPEASNTALSRSIYIVEDLPAGAKLTRDNCRVIRPGYGLWGGVYDQVLGGELRRNVAKGTRLTWDLLKC